jgi:glycolate oxidase FAD binding subunit
LLTETLHTRLAQIVSQETITNETPAVDGKRPALGVAPRSIADLAAVVAELDASQTAAILVGGGTMLDLGAPPTAAEVALSTAGLDAITGYEPADLIVTAESGVTVAALQATLREHGQMLPLEAPLPSQATIGGVLAVNACGPLRYMFGTGKDLVMGMQFVQGDGALVKSGGEVVKNVAGFGLHKLHVGALGTLGVIATATFKVYPVPKADRTLMLSYDDGDAAFATAAAMRAHQPAAAVIGNTVAQQCLFGAVRGPHVLLVRFMGELGAVDRQVRDALAAGAEAGANATEVVGEPDSATLWQKCVDVGAVGAPEDILFQASAVPTQLRHVYAELARSAEPVEGEVGVVADPLNGSLKCGIRAGETAMQEPLDQTSPLAALLSFLRHARAVSEEHGGSLVLQRGTPALKTAFDVWGPNPQGMSVMKNLKQTFDPRHILNPGRFVGEI